MSLLSFRDVSKSFDDIVAVDDVSFSVDRGQVVGFLGPNGAGKSTTMRMITQFYEPDSGEIEFDGAPLGAEPIEVKRRVGYLPENNPLYYEMIVAEYLDFIAQLRDLGDHTRDSIEEAVESTGVASVYYRPIGELSKGFRQRVGLAQAILHRPDFLILDEPTEGLDPNQRVAIRVLISQLGKDRTVLLSTHVLSEVQHTCSRLLIINEGRIVADGPVEDLVARAKGSVKISVEAEGIDVADALGSLEGVTEIETADRSGGRVGVTLFARSGSDLRPKIFETAKANDWTLYELHQEGGSLEDLFRQLTAEG